MPDIPARLVHLAAAPGRRPRLVAPRPLPEIVDEPRAAWAAGWWQGLAVGFTLAIALGIIVAKAVR